MFERLGQFVSRQWLPLLVGWILALVVLWVIAPPLKTVIEDGDFKFLPKDLPSVQAEKLFKNAFENDLLKSSIVIVAHRDNASDGLTDEDKTYIDEKLVPRLRSWPACRNRVNPPTRRLMPPKRKPTRKLPLLPRPDTQRIQAATSRSSRTFALSPIRISGRF